MKNELITRLLPEVQKIIICDKLTFVESKKYNIEGLNKSLYLIFAAYNSNNMQSQAVIYSVADKIITFRVHPTMLRSC